MVVSNHWLQVQPSRCSYQYSIVDADEVVATSRFASYHSRTLSSVPLDLARNASRSLWLSTLTRLARLASLAKPIGLFSRTVAYPPRLTLATRERACEARAREVFKGSHWALCEAMPPGQGDRCLVSFHSCTYVHVGE